MPPTPEHAEAPTPPDRLGPALAVAVGGFGAFTLWRYTVAYPIAWPSVGSEASLAPDGSRVLYALASLGFVAILNLAAWTLGGVVSKLVDSPGRSPDVDLAALARLGYGLLVMPPIVLALAALHLLHPMFLAIALSVPAAIAVPDVFSRLRHRLGTVRRAAVEHPGATLFWLAFGIVVLQGPVLAAFGPELGWDADVYHLAIPHRYLFLNGIEVTPFSMFTAFPAAVEMLYLLALALSGEAAAKLIHLELGLFTFVLLHRVARRESARCALLAGMFLAAEPLLYREMGWAYADLYVAFFGLFATVAWLDWRRTGESALLIRAGLFAGACLSARYLGGTVLLTLLALSWLAPGLGTPGRRAVASIWLGATAALPLLPWLLRNGVWTGNPVAPLLQGLFHAPGAEFFSEIAIAQTIAFDRVIGMGHDVLAYWKLPWNLTVGSVPGTYEGSFGFQIGPLHLIAAVTGSALVAWRRRGDMGLVIVQAWLFVTVWFLVFQEVRFLLPLAATLSLVGAWAFDQLLGVSRRWGVVLFTIPLFALGQVWLSQLDGLGDRFALGLGGEPRSVLWMRDPQRIAVERLRGDWPSDGRLFLVGASRSYLFRGMDYVPYQALEGPPTLDWLKQAEDIDALHCRLGGLAVTHILLDEPALEHRPRPVPGYGSGDFERDIGKVRRLISERGQLVHDRHGVRVARLPQAEGCGVGAAR
jgi:hypothetical protein